ncbi:MAG: EntF family bacteriocin induction factor [Enterococcus avium]
MKNKKLMNVKECSDKKLKRICGRNQWTLGNSKSNVAQCVLSLFKKC